MKMLIIMISITVTSKNGVGASDDTDIINGSDNDDGNHNDEGTDNGDDDYGYDMTMTAMINNDDVDDDDGGPEAAAN